MINHASGGLRSATRLRGHHFGALAAVSILLVAVAGCTTSARQTVPQRTATEQLLLSGAADNAIEQLDLGLSPGTRVFVEPAFLETYDRPYVLGTLRDKLLRSGLRLVPERARAEVVVEPRSGALSIEEESVLVGLPAWDIPVPFAAAAFRTPELALFKRERREGVAKLAVTAYAVEGGSLAGSSGPSVGIAHTTRRVVLFVGWTTEDIPPDRHWLRP
jgi:hypothetical protein